MKRLLLFELLLLILATTFESDSPPGWFQQVLPVNDQINDIFFLDSLTGWVVTQGGNSDTARIMKTTDSGNSWTVQIDSLFNIAVIQFTDNNTGYAAGGNGRAKFLKTTNGGILWTVTTPFGSSISDVKDIFYVNNDTGWFCSDDPAAGGIYKTTNGSLNWVLQASSTYQPKKLFFINKDTGWAGSADWKLYRTTNGGTNWSLQFTFTQQINDIFFFNQFIGVTSSGFSYRTTDGGFNWSQVNDGGIELSFVDDSVGWAGSNFNKVMKTSNGGGSWFRQTSPIFENPSTFGIETLKAWAGGSGLIKTTDGGGPPVGITQIGTEIPTEYKLFQNYPNPFNPKTIIRYNVRRQTSNVKLIVFDLQGKQVEELVNQKQNPGTYEVDFTGDKLSSGIYFYSLIIDGKVEDTKRMILIK